ncbi:MAG: hypothetical protein ACTS42_00335 [Candidatus Hodgkinia cicadicola]
MVEINRERTLEMLWRGFGRRNRNNMLLVKFGSKRLFNLTSGSLMTLEKVCLLC